jgi:signal transduction histidine kinase
VLASVGGLPRFGERKVSLDAAGDPADAGVHANEGEVRQVILNLLINAVEATDPATGRIAVQVSRTGAVVQLAVTDNGRGIDPASLPHLFEPFFSDKRADRPGTGLGLSIAHSIVADHAGTLDAASPGVGQGATFAIRLPAHVPEPAHA